MWLSAPLVFDDLINQTEFKTLRVHIEIPLEK